MVPLAFASLLCILLMGPCSFLEKHRVPKGLAALLMVLGAIIVVIVVFYFISKQIIGFKSDLPKVANELYIGIQDLQLWIQKKFHISADVMKDYLNTATSDTLSHTTSLVGSTFSTLSSTLIYVALIPIYTFLLLLYRKMVVSFLVKSFNTSHTPIVYSVLAKTKAVMKGYIVGLCIEMVIVALMVFLGLMVIGVKYSLLLAVITAVLNLIPYIGIFTATLLTMLITFATGGPGLALGAGIVQMVVHLIDSNFLLPKVVGSKVKINALVTILAVLTGSALWGFSGMFLAIPIVAILKVIFDSVDHLAPWGFILGDEIVVNKAANLMTLKKNWTKPKVTSNQHMKGTGPVAPTEPIHLENPVIINTAKPSE
jgi:putative permease